jgi:hypothetical protein
MISPRAVGWSVSTMVHTPNVQKDRLVSTQHDSHANDGRKRAVEEGLITWWFLTCCAVLRISLDR